jgi:FMNH2-dependent dimethyl sulfone monooxygenase
LDQQPTFGGALGNGNRLKLGTFATNLGRGGTVSSAPGLLPMQWSSVKAIAQQADRLGLELLVPVARWKGFGGGTNYAGPSFETLAWAAGLAAATERCTVFATCHVPVVHPIIAAKQVMTIDHISGGRCGLNVVGGWHRPEIEMFGVPLREHDERYEVAEEWTTIVRELWTRQDEFDFKGRFFDLEGLYAEPKPLQQPRPPIMNAGGSSRGRRFAAEYGDLAFVFVPRLEDAASVAELVGTYQSLARDEFDRSLQVWTSATVVITDTEADARAYERRVLGELADHEGVDNMMRTMGIESAVLGDHAAAVKSRFTAGWGGVPLHGTAEHIAKGLTLMADAGIAGCLLVFPEWEPGLARFGAEVLPLLEQSGLREQASALSGLNT